MIKKLKNKTYKWLRSSEKYLKTDMIYVAKGGFWMTFGQSGTTILSLILVMAFANLLPKETYGTYLYILSLTGVLNIFTLTGMNSAVARAVAVGQEGMLRASVRYQLKWNLLMLTAFFILGGYYLINYNVILAISFFILGIFVPSTLALNTYGSYLEGKRKFKFAGISTIISTLLYVVGGLIAVFLSGEVVWLITAYAFTTFASTLFFYIFIVHKFKLPIIINTETKETLRYGRKLSFIRFIGPISSQIDKIILLHFWGPAQLAIYSLAMIAPNKIISFTKKWVGIGFPKFSAKTIQEINTVFYRRIFQGMAIGATIAVLYALTAPYLFKYLLPQYIEGVFYSQILAISFVFAMPNRYISLLFESQKLSRLIFIRGLINSLVSILLFIIFGILGGILGLIVAQITSSFIGMVISVIVWRLKISKNQTNKKMLKNNLM